MTQGLRPSFAKPSSPPRPHPPAPSGSFVQKCDRPGRGGTTRKADPPWQAVGRGYPRYQQVGNLAPAQEAKKDQGHIPPDVAPILCG